jgi:hypothetical protein
VRIWYKYQIAVPVMLCYNNQYVHCLTVLDGEVAVPCNLQPAIAGWKSGLRPFFVEPAMVSGVEDRVLRNRNE